MAKSRQIPGDSFLVETGSNASQIPGSVFVVQTYSTGGPVTITPADGLHAHTGTTATVSTAGAVDITPADGLHAHSGESIAIATTATITTEPLKNNTGTLLANETGATAYVYDVSTGALVTTKTGMTTNSSGVMVLVDLLFVNGTTYRVIVALSSGAEGMDKYAAT